MIVQLAKKRNRTGMTLVEMVVAVGIGMVVLAVTASLTLYTARSFAALGNYNDLDQASRNALDVMSRDIRQTRSLASYNTNDLTFLNQDGSTLRFVWNPNSKTLSKIQGGTTTVLLEQCDNLRFGTSQRNPTNNFNFYPNSTLGTAKLIDVSWICSRQILQKKVNTESVQTAKIVIRN